MQLFQETATKQSCYLLDSKRIQEQQTVKRKASLVTDFGLALSDFHRETQWETNFWEEMGGVIEYRKYVAELNDDEMALSKMY
ncbi:hypothetical protein ICV01_07325 [Polynucleobacter sp. MWH-Spelu-300-X4]|uniref:hypothetical protein n=1 Tax=Polynucleobacter sp. MWH-Spelu-300-X4 TaxID=2689109 RepID=UPI001BFE352F|nr:hypothetical protein [Polynucleobacter sp. MWH-Spelu-300-X4]QWD79445.1 hypothetical protein ICV01_07325 [Polynucleobacter sp. MWH-Spelu-300-X4]